MKIKIRDKIYDSEKEPIILALSKEERDQINSMSPEDNKFIAYPDGEEWTKNDYFKITEWMISEPVL